MKTAPFLLALIVTAAATPALAGPVTLKANPVDDDGRVTLGDIFDGATGAAAGTVVGSRAGPSVIFDAGALQAQALRAGLRWDNAAGLSRVVVRAASAAPGEPEAGTLAPVVTPTRASAARATAATRAISRNDMVRVEFVSGGVKLTITGRALRNAAVGEPVPILNLQSGRTIDAVAMAPGRAVTGPAAQAFRDAAERADAPLAAQHIR